jgi:hypothetical protein
MKPPEFLTQALRVWRVSPPPDPNFRGAVWQRIEDTHRTTSWPVFVRARAASLILALAVTVGVSGWTGHAFARTRVRADRDSLAANYLASLDARVHAGLKE